MNTTTNYEQQAQAFLDRFAIKFRATLSDSKVAPWAGERKDHQLTSHCDPHHYRVTLSSPMKWEKWGSPQARQINPHRRITFDFWASIADAEKGIKTATPYDVLACISSDTYCPDTFKEWAGEFGESEDSIRALQTYRRCSAFAKRLQSFFTPEEITALQEIQ